MVIVSIVRFIGGFSCAFIYITLLTQIGDNAKKSIRGCAAVGLPMIQSIAMLFSGLASSVFQEAFKNREFAIELCLFMLVITIFIIIITILFTQEPVTRRLKLEEANTSNNILERLYSKSEDNTTAISHIEEMKLMISEDYNAMNNANCFCQIFCSENYKPIIWMLLLRLSNILTSYPILFMYLEFFKDLLRESPMQLIIKISVVKCIALLIPKLLIDKIGRRPLMILSGTSFAACFMIILGLHYDQSLISILLLHALASIGIEPLQHVYAVESFPLSKRNGSLAFITIIEYILHAFLTICFMHFAFPFIIVRVITLIPLMTILFLKLPETKLLGLRYCRDQFKNTNFTYVILGVFVVLTCIQVGYFSVKNPLRGK